MKRIGILTSNNYNNVELIQDAINKGYLNAEIGLIVMSEPVDDVVRIARENNIQTLSLSEEIYSDPVLADEIIATQLQQLQCDFVYVDGYDKSVLAPIYQTYPFATITCHHSLLPAFAGEQCLEASYFSDIKVTGVTFHFIQDVLGLGPIIAQEAIHIDPEWDFNQFRSELRQLETNNLLDVLKIYIEDRILISEEGITKII